MIVIGINSFDSTKLPFSMKSLTFSFFVLWIYSLAQKGKNFSRLLELQKFAPNAKSCSKFVEHNRDRPTDNSNPPLTRTIFKFPDSWGVLMYSFRKSGETRKREPSSPWRGTQNVCRTGLNMSKMKILRKMKMVWNICDRFENLKEWWCCRIKIKLAVSRWFEIEWWSLALTQLNTIFFRLQFLKWTFF